MQLMDNDLLRLVKEGKVTAADAYVKAGSKKDFEPFVEEEEKAAQQKRVPGFKAIAAPQQQPAAPAQPAQRPQPAPAAAQPAQRVPQAGNAGRKV